LWDNFLHLNQEFNSMDSSPSGSMHALVWEAPHVMALRATALPTPKADEVLIKVAYSGICGSELSGYLGHNALRIPPLVMGHEFSGSLVSLGDQAQAINPALQMGQAVTVNPMVYCGHCEYCAQGNNQLCLNRRLIGAHRPGSFAEYVAAPAWMVLPVPTGVSLRDGALTEPLACAVRASHWADLEPGEAALIIGAGAIGLLTLQMLLIKGASHVFIADTDAQRLAAAADLGGEALNPIAVDLVKTVRDATSGRGVAAAVDAVGKAVTREQCIKAVRSGGRVILSGLHEESSLMPVAEVIRREITLHGSFCYSPLDFQTALEKLESKAVRLDPYIQEAPLSEGGAWFERLCAENPGGVAKVLLVP
jgi:threonine dehydrogenase-like Zn-dependent dehydrogenase